MLPISPILVPEVSSTNEVMKQLAADGAPEGTLLVADRQTGGYGRLSREFFSPGGTGLYMSLLLRPTFAPAVAPMITLAAAVAVAEAVEITAGLSAQIKWVNDVYVNGKKAAGILVESALSREGGMDYAIVGVGINLFPPADGFPAAFADRATAIFSPRLKDEFPRLREVLYRQFARRLSPLYDALPDTLFLSDYRRRSLLVGKEIFVYSALTDREKAGVGIPARALDVLENGKLLVEYADGRREALDGGEVTLRV